MNRYMIPLVALVGLMVLFGIGLTLDPHEVPSPLIGKPAPQFDLEQLEDPGRTIATSDLMGKVTLFNVWASWCVACRSEHPVLMDLAKTGAVDIVGMDYKDKRADGLRWLTQLGNPYGVVAHDSDGRVGIDWGVYGVPETFIVDQQGVIRHKHIGPISQDDLDSTILPLIEQLRQGQSG